MDATAIPEPDFSDYVEVDPSGRYGRYNEILGKGASKIVYRAFDEYDGIEVAWNQVKLHHFLQSPEELERLYREIHLLNTLKHKNIMRFCTYWVDSANRNINFVTEMFTSGTLRQYRLKHKRVNIRAVKHWCRQILEGLHYLHNHDPPVIHRDLKCDNIFINGNQGEVKIGDLGLAAILRKAHAVRCVGTPEFMAPEVYEEEYNELVDIYSFGMCILEMVTFDYPYSECTHPAQIYKKVISGKKPEALYKLKDPEVRQFVEKCLATVSSRLSARELLQDPFLQIDDYGYDLRPVDYYGEYDGIHPNPYLRQPLYAIEYKNGSLKNGYTNDIGHQPGKDLVYDSFESERSQNDLFTSQEDHMNDVGVIVEGERQDEDSIFLRLRISDKQGRIRNIYFPFDLKTDTALSVATEMVGELEMPDQDVIKIADMIDDELASLVPEWKKGLGVNESLCETCASNGSLRDDKMCFCENCVSNGSLVDHTSSNGTGARNLQVLSNSNNECASVHGRFEEIMYQVERSGQGAAGDNKPENSNGMQYADIWALRDRLESSLKVSEETNCNEALDVVGQPRLEKEDETLNNDDHNKGMIRKSASSQGSIARGKLDDYENEIRQELRWLKAKYQMQLRELKDQQLGIKLLSSGLIQDSNSSEQKKVNSQYLSSDKQERNNGTFLNSISFRKRFISHFPPLAVNKGSGSGNIECSPEMSGDPCSSNKEMVTMDSFYAGILPRPPLHRAASLPVDSVDF